VKGADVRWIRILVCGAYWILLTVLLLAPHPEQVVRLRQVPMFPWGDTGIHFTAFAILSVLVHVTIWPRRVRWTLAMLVAYGLATESLQWFVPPRAVELKDYTENLLGVFAGAAAYLVLRWAVRRWGTRQGFSPELARVGPSPTAE
jgi:VanZ family protein